MPSRELMPGCGELAILTGKHEVIAAGTFANVRNASFRRYAMNFFNQQVGSAPAESDGAVSSSILRLGGEARLDSPMARPAIAASIVGTSMAIPALERFTEAQYRSWRAKNLRGGRCGLPIAEWLFFFSTRPWRGNMTTTLDPLIRDFVEWIAKEPRRSADALEVWRTSCPRLTVWEDATERGLVERTLIAGEGCFIVATERGLDFLKSFEGSS